MELTVQEVLNKVSLRLRDGTGRAHNKEFMLCVYQTEQELECAVGIFVPEEHMLEFLIDGKSYINLPQDLRDVLPKVLAKHASAKSIGSLGEYIQILHDRDDHWNDTKYNDVGENELEKVCKIFGSEYPPC